MEKKRSRGEAGLKAYTVAIDALEKPESFDTQTDPTVHVLAGRVQTALVEHYVEDGADDPIKITVPTGGYSPVFEASVPAAMEQESALDSSDPEANRSETSPVMMALIIAIPTLALAALICFFALPTAPRQQTGSISVLVGDVPRQTQSPDAQQASLLVRELRSVLARSKSLTVIATQSGDSDASLQVDFSVTGIVERDGASNNFSTELINNRTKAVVWA